MIKQIRTYKITLVQQLLVLSPLILVNSVLIPIDFTLFYGEPFSKWQLVIYAVLIFSFVPGLALHIQYLYFNRSMSVQIDRNAGTIEIIQLGNHYSYHLSDISLLEYYTASGHISK